MPRLAKIFTVALMSFAVASATVSAASAAPKTGNKTTKKDKKVSGVSLGSGR